MSLVHAWRPQTTQTTRAVPLIQHPPSTPRRAEGSSVGVCRRRVVWCACASPDARCMCLPASTSGARADQWPLRFSRLYPRPPHRPQRRPTLTSYRLGPGFVLNLFVRSFVAPTFTPSSSSFALSLVAYYFQFPLQGPFTTDLCFDLVSNFLPDRPVLRHSLGTSLRH